MMRFLHSVISRCSGVLYALLLLCLALPAVGCGKEPTSEAIEYCIPLEPGAGRVPTARVLPDYDRYDSENRPTRADTVRFLVATESPFTVVDREVLGVSTGDASVTEQNLRLAVTDAVSDPVATRALFWDVSALVQPLGLLGPRGSAERYDGVIGGDLLRQYAVRIVLETDPTCRLPWLEQVATWPSLSFRQELPDSAKELSADGYGVLPYDLVGGGTAELRDASFSFGATRVTVGACVAPEPFDPTAPIRMADIPLTGVDAWVLVATGTQPLVVSQSFYERLAATKSAERGEPWPTGLAAGSVFLPEGETFATQLGLERLALVSSRSDKQSPCLELQQRRRIEWAERCRADPECAATMNDEEQAVGLGRRGPAVLEVDVTRGGSGAKLATFVVSDETLLFSGLRGELGTSVPAVDLLVGAAFLRYFEVLLDYPSSRLVMRCADYKVPVVARDCDPSASADHYASCCPAEATLAREGRSCCDTSGGVDGAGRRHARSCHCAGSVCCQYFRYDPD